VPEVLRCADIYSVILFMYFCLIVGRVAQSVQRLATGWTVRGSNSGFGGLGFSMLAFGTQDRGFAPDRSRRIFPAGKIHSMPSFGRGSERLCAWFVTRTTKAKKGQKGQQWYKKIPVGVRFLTHVQTGLGAHPASCTMGTRYFLLTTHPF
jgi:hypothetical protein